jgi:HSP20 family protein
MEPDAGVGVGEDRPRNRARRAAEDPRDRLGPFYRRSPKDRDLIIRVSLSGVSPEDVEITLSNDVLTVSGQRRSDPEDVEETFYVRERYYGAFRRSWTLPAGIGDDDISADFENGLLEITVRGAAAAVPEPRRIEIRRRL